MKFFVMYNKVGKILSVAKMSVLPKGMVYPYAKLSEDESVIEVEQTEALLKISCIDIHKNYKVDVNNKKLVPVGED